MSEVALRTTERKLQTAKALFWRPAGSTIVCCSDHAIRRKWLEISCDLVAPYKRERYTSLPGYDKLVEAWTPQLREAWLEFDRPTEKYKLGQLLQDDAFPQSVWQMMIEPIGVLADMPFAPESDRRVYDTWLWNEQERKTYFIVHNNDAGRTTVEGWQGVEERDADTGAVLNPLLPGTERDPKINVAIVWAKQIKYKTDLELSIGTLDDIATPDKPLHPRFDKPVAMVKAIRPEIEVVL